MVTKRGVLPRRSRVPSLSAFEPGEFIAPLICTAVVLTLISIFAAGVVLLAAVLCWISDGVKRRRVVLGLPAFSPWLLAFLGAGVIAIAASPDLLASLKYLEKFVRFLWVFVFFGYASRRQIEKTLYWIFGVVSASALWGLLQYCWFENIDLMHRIDGFMSHWMTFSGQVMMSAVMIAAFLLFRPKQKGEWKWLRLLLWLALAVLMTACLLSMTRSAWLGLSTGIGLLLVLRHLRLAIPGALVLVLVLIFLPAQFKARLYSGFDLNDTTTQGRVELAETGIEMIRLHPWTGVGPRLVQQTAVRLKRSDGFPPELFQHLHNNALQIAAEMGLPALLIWLGFWIRVVVDLWRFRSSGDEFLCFLAHAALAALLSFQLMGLFEYNFGDSEIVVLLFFIISAPYVVGSSYRVYEGNSRVS
ncbi:MAG: O-antigen ligase family protein [Acidobacteriota bacterium]